MQEANHEKELLAGKTLCIKASSSVVNFEVEELLMTHVPASCEVLFIAVFLKHRRLAVVFHFTQPALKLLHTPQEALGSLQGWALEVISNRVPWVRARLLWKEFVRFR